MFKKKNIIWGVNLWPNRSHYQQKTFTILVHVAFSRFEQEEAFGAGFWNKWKQDVKETWHEPGADADGVSVKYNDTSVFAFWSHQLMLPEPRLFESTELS